MVARKSSLWLGSLVVRVMKGTVLLLDLVFVPYRLRIGRLACLRVQQDVNRRGVTGFRESEGLEIVGAPCRYIGSRKSTSQPGNVCLVWRTLPRFENQESSHLCMFYLPPLVIVHHQKHISYVRTCVGFPAIRGGPKSPGVKTFPCVWPACSRSSCSS